MAKGAVQNIIEHYRGSGTVEPKPQNPERKSSFCAKDLALLEQRLQFTIVPVAVNRG